MRASKNSKHSKALIYVRYNHGDQACYFSTKELLDPQYWDSKNELVRKSYRGFTSLNNYLQKRKFEIEEIRLTLQTNGIEPIVSVVREEYNRRCQGKLREKESLLDHWPAFVNYQRDIKRVREGTIKQYHSSFVRLQDFEKFINRKLTFRTIDQDFIEQFTYYLFSLRHSNSTVGSKIKNVKTFMQWAWSKGHTTNLKFKEFKKLNNRTDIVTINQDQLNKLFTLDLTHNPKLERIRDLFILGCSTGLRFSDLVHLSPANIKDNHIQIASRKTDTVVRIPINDYSRAILLKYERLPKPSNSLMNLRIKEIARIAGFNELHEVTSYKGGYVTKIIKPLYELITTHTMRRVFATQSLQRGMQAQDVIRLTGHSSLRTFQAYLHASDQRLESEVAKAWNTAPKIPIAIIEGGVQE